MRTDLPTIEHAGVLEELERLPAYIDPGHLSDHPHDGQYSCAFCGVGDSGRWQARATSAAASTASTGSTVPTVSGLAAGDAVLVLTTADGELRLPVRISADREMEVATTAPLCDPGGTVAGQVVIGEGPAVPVRAREVDRSYLRDGAMPVHRFALYDRQSEVTQRVLRETTPTGGCVKLRLSLGHQRPAYPIHVGPSILETDGRRSAVTYAEAIGRLSDLVLDHLAGGKVMVYASGQLDYFAIFAMQEVFRLLGVRNITGNAEHCLNAGAVHNEMLTGQEGPFLTIEQSIEGPGRVHLFNGWNGKITHPPIFRELMKREDLDAYLVEVAVTETALELAERLGPDRVLLVRPGSDPHLALAVAGQILRESPELVEHRFIDRFADADSFERFAELATSARFEPHRVAKRIAPEPDYEDRLERGIEALAYKIAWPDTIPINLPSVGLSQTSGVVGHCLWGSVLAMVGKYGLRPDGTPAGGTLRAPGQINAESEVQGLSRKYFMGRILVQDAAEAAVRMGLPPDAYDDVLSDEPVAALDYSDPSNGQPTLVLCFGTQFEANMMNRPRWLAKLQAPEATLVVVDPIPDPFSLQTAELVIPSPPHSATTKVYQNGEWKLSLSVPQKRAAQETRSDATILYDLMAAIGQRLEDDQARRESMPRLAAHVDSGYWRQRFADGLTRLDGEVSRPELWSRLQEYMSGGCGPLYCRPEHADGSLIDWAELLEEGSLRYGGVGETRYVLDYDTPGHQPFADIYRNPAPFRFFVPTEDDLTIPEGILLNSGRGTLSTDPKRIQFATASFNSGKATPISGMPDFHPLFVSPSLAERLRLRTGDIAKVTGRESGASIELPVEVSDRVKGDSVYVSFHKSRAQMEDLVYINDVTGHTERCPYTGQTRVKATSVVIERVGTDRRPLARITGLDPSAIDLREDLPFWQGQNTPLVVTAIIPETHDTFTYRFQGDPPCRFGYLPGQFCSLVLNIDGKKVVRSYTISSSPSRPYSLDVTIKRVTGGLVSNWMAENVRVGDRIEVSGPKGRFHLTPGEVPERLLLIGAGSGVTPAMSMARWLHDVAAEVDVVFLNSIRGPSDWIFGREIEYLASRHRHMKPIVTSTHQVPPGQTWFGLTGRLTPELLRTTVPDLLERSVYMCGPQGFMDAVTEGLAELGYDLANLHTESFGGLRTSSAAKLPPVGIGSGASTPADPSAAEGPLSVQFATSGQSVRADGAMTLLEIAEANDVDLPYGCRSGSCGDCEVRLLSGKVQHDYDDALDPVRAAQGWVLSCTAHPIADVVLDA